MDMSILCCGCMQEIDLNDVDKCFETTTKMFTFCTKLEISEDCNLPQKFCCSCVQLTKSSYKFITRALEVHRILRESLVTEDKYVVKSELKSEDDHPVAHLTAQENKKQVSNIKMEHCKSRDSVKDDKNDLDEIYTERRNICKICNKDFKSKAWFDRHMEKEHSGNTVPGRYNCDYCSKSFVRKVNFERHVRNHLAKTKVHSCDVCKKRFTNTAQLRSHAVTHLNKEYECEDCSKKFKTKYSLTHHIQSFHTNNGIGKFLCATCGVGFRQAGALKEHSYTHSKARHFSCDSCKASFRQASTLHQHKLRLHAGVRRKECPQCSKKFYTSADLDRHMRRHTGEWPYKCPLCPRSFIDSWHRKCHIMRAHGASLADIPSMDREGQPVDKHARYKRRAALK